MRLSTIECAHPTCDQEVSGDVAMYHVIEMAADEGWTFFEDSPETKGFCPLHGPDQSSPAGAWLVGCWTCGWEEEVIDEDTNIPLSEDDAKYWAKEHECEPDTYLRSPAMQAERRQEALAWQEKRAIEREQERVAHAQATARQIELEKHAKNWIRIRNIVLPWRREKR